MKGMPSPEQRILLHCAAHPHEASGLEELKGLVSCLGDAESLVEDAVREGMACLLYKSLLRAGALERMGSAQGEHLRSLYYHTLLSNLKATHEVKTILSRANRERVSLVLLQGIVLIREAYGDPGLRPMTDIDLWVPEDGFSHLRGILIGLGYRNEALFPGTFTRGSTRLDVHNHLFWADRIRSRRGLIGKSQDAIYEATEEIAFEGQSARSLNPCDQVLYLSLHALKHRVGRLLWLVDIYRILRGWQREDWRKLVLRAEEMGQYQAMLQILYLLGELFRLKPPRGFCENGKGRRLHFLEKRLLAKRTTGGELPGYASLFLMVSGMRFSKKVALVLETLFPRQEILKQVFPESQDAGAWRLYGKRLLYMVREIVKGQA